VYFLCFDASFRMFVRLTTRASVYRKSCQVTVVVVSPFAIGLQRLVQKGMTEFTTDWTVQCLSPALQPHMNTWTTSLSAAASGWRNPLGSLEEQGPQSFAAVQDSGGGVFNYQGALWPWHGQPGDGETLEREGGASRLAVKMHLITHPVQSHDK